MANDIKSVEDYPDNYDNLSEEQKESILNYLNSSSKLAYHYYDKHFVEQEDSTQKSLTLYNETLSNLAGAKAACKALGIMVEFNWPNHPKEWILATKTDVEEYNNKIEEQPIEDEITNILLNYSDIGL